MVTTRSSKRKHPIDTEETDQNPRRKQGKSAPQDPSKRLIFTIGHGTRTLDELITLLQSVGVTKLVDVRSIPRSRTNPQFNRESLHASVELQTQGIEYIWRGPELGGRRNSRQPDIQQHTAIRVEAFRNYAGYMCTPSFQHGLELLEDLANDVKTMENGSLAIMCSETLWWRCHRRMISDSLVVRGWEVRHLGIQKEPALHHMWDIARVGNNRELIYDGK